MDTRFIFHFWARVCVGCACDIRCMSSVNMNTAMVNFVDIVYVNEAGLLREPRTINVRRGHNAIPIWQPVRAEYRPNRPCHARRIPGEYSHVNGPGHAQRPCGWPWGCAMGGIGHGPMATHHPRLLLLEGPHVIVCVGVCIYEAPDVG